MIQVWFPDDDTPLEYADADAAEVSSSGTLRVFKRNVTEMDKQLGAVAPGWRYYTITDPVEPAPEAPEEPSEQVPVEAGT